MYNRLRYISINIFVLHVFYHVRNRITCFISIRNLIVLIDHVDSLNFLLSFIVLNRYSYTYRRKLLRLLSCTFHETFRNYSSAPLRDPIVTVVSVKFGSNLKMYIEIHKVCS